MIFPMGEAQIWKPLKHLSKSVQRCSQATD